MNQLFYNLVGNALKFSRPGLAPDIKITCEKLSPQAVTRFMKKPDNTETYFHIRLKDHGIGFDPDQAEKIFEVFKRLYTSRKYQGSGIGLALCRRIIQTHGGELFAESKPGEGSTFHIIIPQSERSS
jgi:signal transduction histidine kinase